jgi:phage replication O-like protein O
MDSNINESYTKIINVVLDALQRLRCSGCELNIILAVIRYTYGYHRDYHEMAYKYLSLITGRDKRFVARQVKRLLLKHILIEVRPYSSHTGRYLAINENVLEWDGYNAPPVVNSDDKAVDKNDHIPVVQSDPYKRKLKKEKKEKEMGIPYKNTSPPSTAVASGAVWIHNDKFTITVTKQLELQTKFDISEATLRHHCNKMLEWLKLDKNANVRFSLQFCENWLERNKHSKPVQKDSLPLLGGE